MRPTLYHIGWTAVLGLACSLPQVGHSQSTPLPPPDSSSTTRLMLDKRISLDLRDATLLEALFAVRDITGLNLVVGNEVTGTVNAAFTDARVDQILDSLLIPRGYSYRVVSGSLAILPIESVGDRLPNFETVVIRLQVNQPEDVLAGIESILSPEGRIHSIPSSNSLMIMDYADRIVEVREQIDALERAAQDYLAQTSTPAANSSGQLPAAASAGQYVRVYRPQFVPAASLAEGLRPFLTPETGQLSALEAEDKLVVTDSAEVLDRISQALLELDVPRPQVRVWALIYDCSLEDLEACGINFSSGVNGSEIDATSGNPRHRLLLDSVTSSVAAPTNGVMTMSTINRLGSLNTIIQALETGDDTRLLADPNVVVMNHESAQIEIVTEVPYQQLTQGIDGGQIGTTEFREAGVQLTVTPHIAQDNTISMQINPRFSLLTGFTENDNAPIIDRREAQTTVRIENLQTLVLGGLRQRTRTVQTSGIPGLSKVPYLGHLFRYRRSNARESELIVFITPEIISTNYAGTARELCVGETLHHEIEQTRSDPRPFGYDVLIAEKKAYNRAMNQCHKHKSGTCVTSGTACSGCPNCRPNAFHSVERQPRQTPPLVPSPEALTSDLAVPAVLVTHPTSTSNTQQPSAAKAPERRGQQSEGIVREIRPPSSLQMIGGYDAVR